MSITKQDVSHVAKLSRIEFSEKEAAAMEIELGSVLDYVDTLNKIDTSSVKPTEHILAIENVVRKDEVKPSLPLDFALKNAPDSEAGCFKVPRVLE